MASLNRKIIDMMDGKKPKPKESINWIKPNIQGLTSKDMVSELPQIIESLNNPGIKYNSKESMEQFKEFVKDLGNIYSREIMLQ